MAAGDAVFLDVSSLKPGDLWDEKILGAVKEASVFVLCRCCACESSSFVAKEIGAALSTGGKKLVPVLFCSAPLPAGMADRQWIDLRGKVVHECPGTHRKRASSQYRINRVKSPRVILDDYEDTLSPDAAPPPRPSRAPEPYAVPAPPAAPAAQTERPPLAASQEPGAAPDVAPTSVSRRGTTVGAILLAVGVAGAGACFFGSTTITTVGPSLFGLAMLAVFGVVALVGFGVLLRRALASIRARNERRRAEKIAARAASYFEGLAGRVPSGVANP